MHNNDILRRRFLAHVGQTSPSPMMIPVERAEGVFFYTPEGKPYYDLVAGVSVSNAGHSNPAVIEAVKRQVERYMHVMVYGELLERPQVEYATEIAAVMLQRQQASAIIDARKMIVDGAVGMVEMALERLSQNDTVQLDEERKAAMVSNLLVVLCGNKDAQPIVNSGSIY